MKQAIVVLGFHRSGTSALTGVLDALGAYTGNNPIPPSEINERGFFENMRVYEANEYILNELCGISWEDVENPNRLVDMGAIEAILKFVLKRTFANNPVIAVKDPRITLLLPAYRSVLKDMGYEITFLKPVRDKDSVANSVSHRFGLSYNKAIKLLDQYNKIELDFSMNKGWEEKVGMIQYEDLLSKPDEVIKFLKTVVPFLNYSEENVAKAKAFLSPDLKHF